MPTKHEVLEAAAHGEGTLGRSAADEPVFVIAAREAWAPAVVRDWAQRAMAAGASVATLTEAVTTALAMTQWRATKTPDSGDHPPTSVVLVGPPQLNTLPDTDDVTVTWPPGSQRVLSIQPNGDPDTRAAGTAGPYERARPDGDRLIYAPLGPNGPVYGVLFTPVLPNT